MPRPQPPAPPVTPPDDPTEFERPREFGSGIGTIGTGPRELARATEGSWMIGGRSQVVSE